MYRSRYISVHYYTVTLPVGVMRELKWQEKQKVVVKKRGKGIIITDWKK